MNEGDPDSAPGAPSRSTRAPPGGPLFLGLNVFPAEPVRGGRLGRRERILLREILLSLAGGDGPTAQDLAHRTGLSEAALPEALRSLEAGGCIVLDGDRIRAAYPFTADDVPHEVTSSRGRAHACCAIDALGVGAMLGETVDVRSRCARCGAAVRLRGRNRFRGEPGGTVVFLPPSRTAEGKPVDCVCPAINFYCNADHGRAHLGELADRGRFLSMEGATTIAVAAFGTLLDSLTGDGG